MLFSRIGSFASIKPKLAEVGFSVTLESVYSGVAFG
jgi:hypothetical protein